MSGTGSANRWWEVSTTRADGTAKQAVRVRLQMTEMQMKGFLDILKNLAVETDIRFGVEGDGPACLSSAHVWAKADPHAVLQVRRMQAEEMIGLAGVNRSGEELYG